MRFSRAAASFCGRQRPYKLPDCLRMTVGLDEHNERVIAALTDFMEGTGS